MGASSARRWRVSVNACGPETLVLERANKFNPRCTEARLLGFRLKSSRYIAVDFDGRFRMVWTIKRADADDRWKVVSPRDPFSAADLESTPAEFSCSRGLRNVWRGIRLMLSRYIQITIRFREDCTSNRVTSWRTGRQIVVRVAEHWSVVVVHKATPRNAEFASRRKS